MRRPVLAALSVSLIATAGGALAMSVDGNQAPHTRPAALRLAAAGTAGKEISGTVEKVDQSTGRIVVGGETLYMPQTSEAPTPKVGDNVSFGYEEQGGRKVITSFRQAQKR